MPVKKKRVASKKTTAKKTATKKAQPNPLVETQTLQREILKSQNKLDKTYAKFLSQFKKQRDRFKVKIKQARERFSSAKTSYRKSNIRTMIKALEEKKKDLTTQLDQVSREYKKFSAQQKVIQQFEKGYEKKLKEAARKKQPKKATKTSTTKKQLKANAPAASESETAK
jgi:hypothetical protein